MSVRNLEHFFKPATIALVGASPRDGSVGQRITRNLREGGFAGPVLLVHPRHRAIEGTPAYPDVGALPATPDLAVVCTPPDVGPGVIRALGERGTRAAVVITAGFAESGEERGRALHAALLEAARPFLLRIVGPNCLGLLSPGTGVNASFAHLSPSAGQLAFVAQSGAILTSILDWAQPRGIGFSHLVSLGDMVDVDFGDLLDYLANDTRTRAILLYIEAVTHARKFMSAARAAARTKPVIVAGDFNTFWGDHEIYLFCEAAGLVSANLQGLPSYPSRTPRKELDFILHSRQIEMTRFEIPPVTFSDHLPLICEFRMRGG